MEFFWQLGIDDWGKRGQLKVLVVDTESVAL
jgi:hypothetical protein